MRLWHQALIPYLPRQQLLGQHRECCALRGKGWGRKHKIVDYVFKHSFKHLYLYHSAIVDEMLLRGFKINNRKWANISYRGLKLGYDPSISNLDSIKDEDLIFKSYLHDLVVPHEELLTTKWIYPEHDAKYLLDCLENLKNKGVILKGISFEEIRILYDLRTF